MRVFRPIVQTFMRAVFDTWHNLALCSVVYPAVVNHPAETALAVEVARTVMGEDSVDPDHSQLMGSEDFAFMLEHRAGNIALLGNGSTAGLHDPGYDFNDAAIPYGVGYWTRLVETAMPVQKS
ncbi:M20/M25/M40 family metallo-hydrolase [Neorhizobium galegae]